VPNIRYYSVSSISALLSIMICVTFTTLHMVDNGEFRHFNRMCQDTKLALIDMVVYAV